MYNVNSRLSNPELDDADPRAENHLKEFLEQNSKGHRVRGRRQLPEPVRNPSGNAEALLAARQHRQPDGAR